MVQSCGIQRCELFLTKRYIIRPKQVFELLWKPDAREPIFPQKITFFNFLGSIFQKTSFCMVLYGSRGVQKRRQNTIARAVSMNWGGVESARFGLGVCHQNFFYRYCIACKMGSSHSKKRQYFNFLNQYEKKIGFYRLYNNDKKNFSDIPPRPKFFEESDGATRFLIGPRSFGEKYSFIRGFLR